MKKMFLTAFLVTGTLSAAADDYPYLTFETADGTKTSVSASSLTISVGDGKLTVGSQEFTLSDLSKMYFSASDETTSGIDDLNSESTSQRTTIFDLQGRKVNQGQMKRGVYVVKTSRGTSKIMKK